MNKYEKIDINLIEDIISLTPMQEGMLFHNLQYPNSSQYYEQTCYKLTGNISVDIIKKSWKYVIDTNEMLRAIYRWKGLKKAAQIILNKVEVDIVEHDLSDENECMQLQLTKDIERNDRENKVDIYKQILRITLCKLTEQKYEMIVNTHHISFDGWSNIVILKELLYAYNCYYNGDIPKVKYKNKYKELIKWYIKQNENMQKEFWTTYLDGYIHNKTIPFVNEKQFNVEIKEKSPSVLKDIPDSLSSKMKNFINDNKITYATLFYMAWSILLYKNIHIGDIVFGTTVSGRTADINGIEDIVGLFINTIPLRIKIDDEINICELAIKINEMTIKRDGYEFTSLSNIKKFCGYGPDKNIFDSAVVVENYPIDDFLNRKRNSNININFHSSYYNTNLSFVMGIRMFEGIQLDLVYDTEIYTIDDVEKIAEQYICILTDITEDTNIEKKIIDINLMNNDEKKHIINAINRTNETINLFEEIDFNEIF